MEAITVSYRIGRRKMTDFIRSRCLPHGGSFISPTPFVHLPLSSWPPVHETVIVDHVSLRLMREVRDGPATISVDPRISPEWR